MLAGVLTNAAHSNGGLCPRAVASSHNVNDTAASGRIRMASTGCRFLRTSDTSAFVDFQRVAVQTCRRVSKAVSWRRTSFTGYCQQISAE